MSYLFGFGLGYTGCVAARMAAEAGFRVAGTSRGEAACAELRAQGFEAHPFDRDHPLAPNIFAGATHVLVAIPPDAAGDPALACHGAELAALPALRWLGYLSTTGVYGDTGGAWVDETAPVRPTVARSRRRAAAEAAWLEAWRGQGLPVHVFRLAGIYGPGQSAVESARTGKAHRIVKPGQVFGRIHVEDIARVLLASMAKPDPGAIYNVCDDEPAPPQDVIAYACARLGLAPPSEIPWTEADSVLSPMARSFYADNRRVKNGRIKRELGVTLKYPTYRDGIDALVSAPFPAGRERGV